MKSMHSIAGAVLLIASTLAAQAPAARRFEVNPFVGAYVPTGRLADDFNAGVVSGVKLGIALAPQWRLVATGSWVDIRNKSTVMHKVESLWQYDVGAELTSRGVALGNWTFKPFVGAGGGAHTYDFTHAAMSNTTHGAGYVAIGHELLYGALGIRCEARDYVSGYHVLGGETSTRNSLGFTAGAAVHF